MVQDRHRDRPCLLVRRSAALAEGLATSPTAPVSETRPGPGRPVGAAPPPGSERLTLTVEEAATSLGLSRAFASEAVRRGEIPSIRIGRRVLVPRVALHRLVGGDAVTE